jgi:hypothetical protein
MHRTKVTRVFSCVAAAALSLSACNRAEQNKPVAEVQTQTPVKPAAEPTTVSGCLRAGDAADVFVLTASQAVDGGTPATYQLVGLQGVNLKDHVGNRVEVNGVLRAQQQTSTRAAAPAAGSDKSTGTSGSPTVETRTSVDIRQLDVSAVKPLGQGCDK